MSEREREDTRNRFQTECVTNTGALLSRRRGAVPCGGQAAANGGQAHTAGAASAPPRPRRQGAGNDLAFDSPSRPHASA
eukprot:8419186-Pyramimonas_sp.AAC.2